LALIFLPNMVTNLVANLEASIGYIHSSIINPEN
jgi:hypothetical protein